MRKYVMVGVVGAVLMAGQRAAADPVTAGDIVQLRLTDVNGTSLTRFSNGGPFRMDLPGSSPDFLTFCLERDEYFTPGENLLIKTISEEARAGGVNTNSGDPISGTTAFLYTMFRQGNPAFANGKVMQEAIWFLEEEVTTRSAAAANMIALAQIQMLAAGWTPNYLGGVRVANLYRGANFSTHAQDMLTIVNVPEPATLFIMGVGLLVATYGRRHRSVR